MLNHLSIYDKLRKLRLERTKLLEIGYGLIRLCFIPILWEWLTMWFAVAPSFRAYANYIFISYYFYNLPMCVWYIL